MLGYTFTSQEEKIEYLNDVFNSIGANDNFVSMISEELIDKLVNAERFGYSDISKNDSSNISARAHGSEGRDFDDTIHLGIIWAKSGSEYTILGGCEWLDLPIMRIDDIVSIDLGAGSIVNGSQVLAVQYEKNGTVHEESYDKDDENYKGTGSACAFEFDLPNIADSIYVLVGYNVVNSSDENTITLQYFHKFLPLPISVSVSYIGGFSISPEDIFTKYPLQCGTYQGDDY